MSNIPVTRRLAEWIVGLEASDIPDSVQQEGVRTFVNWLGCAIGGADHETADRAIAAFAPFSGPAQASVLGRKERFDVLHAALMNGVTSHVLDYDDTHLKTIIHPAGPVASALMAKDGRRIEHHVDHAIGSIHRPLTNDELDAKFLRQAARVIGEEKIGKVISLAWTLAGLANVADLSLAATPA